MAQREDQVEGGAVVVAAERVGYRFGVRGDVLRDITLAACVGVSIGIVGANGSGKTTLMRLLSGALRPTEGMVWYADGMTPERDIAMVSADPQTQLLTTSVFDEVAFSLRARRMPWSEIQERVAETLTAFDMDAWARRHPWDLSMGEQLRVLTAAALVRRPRLLILDEVASMIDMRSWRAVQRVVERGRQQGLYGVITVSHRLEDLRGVDRVVLLHEGALALAGALEQIFEQALAHPEWRLQAPLTYATWRALTPQARERYMAIWPAREENMAENMANEIASEVVGAAERRPRT